ncbi:MAG: hypothetical protein AAF226_03475, partial [Verrucomicrobiota bacterium]
MMTKSLWVLAIVGVALVMGRGSDLRAEDWPSWRGPSHNGSRAGEGYPQKFAPESAEWKVALPGKGASSPIVSGDRIYLTCPNDGQDSVMALGLDGKLVWQ